MFRSRLPHSAQNKPTIVHCRLVHRTFSRRIETSVSRQHGDSQPALFSAGVGRSGTFIAIDRLLQTIQIDRPIDVFGIVHEMRFERCHMVQNEVRELLQFLPSSTVRHLPQSLGFAVKKKLA